MALSFDTKYDLGLIGSGTYRFRHYGSNITLSYEVLEYIYSTGNARVLIDDVTSVNYPGYAGYDIDIKITTRSRSWGRYMGNNDLPPYPTINNNTSGTGSGNIQISSYINGSTQQPIVTFATSSDWRNIVVDDDKVYIDSVLQNSGLQNQGWTAGTTGIGFGLFSTNWVAGGAQCYIGTCDLYAAGVKIKQLVPVKRNIDSALGYYDRLSNTFYPTSDNPSNLTAGPTTGEVITPS